MVTSAIARQKNSFHQNNKLPHKLFGTDGIRGKVGEFLTAELAFHLGVAAGKIWREIYGQGIVILGQDSRNSSTMLAQSLSDGLTAVGLDVWDLGLCPTPCVSYLTRKTEAIAGVMISASHNPPQDNGIKFFSDRGTKLSTNLTQQIEAKLRQQFSKDLKVNLSSYQGKNYQQTSLVKEYVEFLQNTLPVNLNFQGRKIVLDLAWGAAVNIAPSVFQALGAEVITIHHLADGDRINVNCGSTHLQSLQKAVQENQADFGFAFDGDADRVMAVTNKGQVVCGDYILYLWGKYLQEQNLLPHNLLIGTVMANLGFELAWQKIGGKLIRTAVGDQNVQHQMWESGAMLGGEQSGHILCHHHHFSGDGIQTAVQLTALVCQQGGCLNSLLEGSFQPYPQLLKNVVVKDREKRLNWQQSTKIQQAIALAEQAMANQGRVLVRASGTEPVIRVMVEAQNQDLVQHWTDNLVTVIKQNLAT